jgi:hypothetical protein
MVYAGLATIDDGGVDVEVRIGFRVGIQRYCYGTS